MRNYLFILLLLSIIGCSNVKTIEEPTIEETIIKNTETKEIIILATSDIHGRIFNHEYGGFDKSEEKSINEYSIGGFAKVATFIKEMRNKYPDLVLVDLGDTYFFEPFNTKRSPNIIPVLNYLNYDLFVLGNHELYLKKAVLEKDIEKFTGNIITNNMYIDNKRYDKTLDYKILNVKGINLAFTGSTVPQKGIRKFLLSSDYDVNDPYLETKRVEEEMSKNYDFFVGLEHITDSKFDEYNGAKVILEKSSSIDLMLNGHMHNGKKEKANEKYLVHNFPYGTSAILVKIIFIKKDNKWIAANIIPTIYSLDKYKPDKDFMEKFMYLDKETIEYEDNGIKGWEKLYNNLHEYFIP